MHFSHLKTLVSMQLKDKLDLSFTKNKRSLILKMVKSVLQPIIATAVFYLLFMLAVMFSVFSFTKLLPDTVINLVFAVVQIMAVVSCTIGLTQGLYASADNRVLLTLPVGSTEIFLSKLMLFYIFELKRNVSFTLPMFLAYGMVNGAVFYYYIWAIFCFFVISLLPVVIGAVFSMPTMFVVNFVKRKKLLQFALMLVCAALVVWLIVSLINLLPENINILGQWGAISESIQGFLNGFAQNLSPFYWLCLMVVGGTLRISTHLFGWDTLKYFVGALAVIMLFFFLALLLARPLFFKTASRQFEYEKTVVPPRKNKRHSVKFASFAESFKMEFRSSRNIVIKFLELALPAILILFLNKIYAAMNTSFSGQKLTQTFNIVVMVVTVLSFNSPYASVYSREANARNILKTRPANMRQILFARIFSRVVTIALSCFSMIYTYKAVSAESFINCACLFVCITAISLAHLFWCAEIDVMHSQADQYQTIGSDYDNPNERTATVISLVLTTAFALMFSLFTDRGVTVSFCKIAVVATVLLAVRIYLYVTRAKLYFVEN